MKHIFLFLLLVLLLFLEPIWVTALGPLRSWVPPLYFFLLVFAYDVGLTWFWFLSVTVIGMLYDAMSGVIFGFTGLSILMSILPAAHGMMRVTSEPKPQMIGRIVIASILFMLVSQLYVFAF